MSKLPKHTVNGRSVRNAKVFEEGQYWRWRIIDDTGAEFLDGGNFRNREDAEKSLREAFDPR